MSATTSPSSLSSKGGGKIPSKEIDCLDGRGDGARISSQAPPARRPDADDADDDDDETDTHASTHSKDDHEKGCTSINDEDGDDDYSWRDEDECSISDYIQGEIERQLTEEIDAALQREIDAQLDRAIEECERELDRQLEDELEKNVHQSLQIGGGSIAFADAGDDQGEFDTCTLFTDNHCTGTSRSTTKTDKMQREGTAVRPTNNTASTKGKEGEEEDDVLLSPRRMAKNETSSSSSSSSSSGRSGGETKRMECMKRTMPITSVVDVNKTIQSVIDSHKIRYM